MGAIIEGVKTSVFLHFVYETGFQHLTIVSLKILHIRLLCFCYNLFFYDYNPIEEASPSVFLSR